MNTRITKAFATYQTSIAPAAIKSALASMSHCRLIDADGIRAGALLTLQAALEVETDAASDCASESAIRTRAGRMGYSVSKSRDRSLHHNNCGQFMLCDDRNTVVLGDRFDASIQDIAYYLTRKAA
jgi:hypothetical protein